MVGMGGSGLGPCRPGEGRRSGQVRCRSVGSRQLPPAALYSTPDCAACSGCECCGPWKGRDVKDTLHEEAECQTCTHTRELSMRQDGPSYLESLSCWRKEETKNKREIRTSSSRGGRISTTLSDQASRRSHCAAAEGCPREQGPGSSPPSAPGLCPGDGDTPSRTGSSH